MQSSDLTVVVPTFNGERHLAATLDSLHNQTVRPAVLIVDDGSRDRSADVARDHPIVTRVLRQENRGVAAARNRGLAIAATRWVAFLDQDDLWHSTRAERVLSVAEREGHAACGTAEQAFALESDREALGAIGDDRASWVEQWIPDDGESTLVATSTGLASGLVHEVTLARLMSGAATVTTSFVYDREAAITAGGCAPFIRAADDHVLNVNLASIHGPLLRIDDPLVFYRVHPEATTNSSPLVTSLLTLQLALRHGRALPSQAVLGPNLEHLMWNVDTAAGLGPLEKAALLVLSSPPGDRMAWLTRWARRSMRASARRTAANVRRGP